MNLRHWLQAFWIKQNCPNVRKESYPTFWHPQLTSLCRVLLGKQIQVTALWWPREGQLSRDVRADGDLLHDKPAAFWVTTFWTPVAARLIKLSTMKDPPNLLLRWKHPSTVPVLRHNNGTKIFTSYLFKIVLKTNRSSVKRQHIFFSLSTTNHRADKGLNYR